MPHLPSRSRSGSRRPLESRASVIVRNFQTRNGRPSLPPRTCRKKIGEPRWRLTSTARVSSSGERRIMPKSDPAMSTRRLAAIVGHRAFRDISSRRSRPALLSEDAGHPFLLGTAHTARAGKTDPLLEELLGDGTPDSLGLLPERLQVHRLPYWPRLDVVSGKRIEDVVTTRAKLIRVNQKTGEPVGMLSPRRLRHRLDAGQVGQCLAVSREHGSTLLYPLGKHPQLPTSDRCQYVAEAIIVAKLGVFVGDPGVARLSRPEAGFVHQLLLLCHQHAATGGSDDLVAIEGKCGDGSPRTNMFAFVCCPQRLGSVFQDRHFVAAANLQNGFQIRASAVKVDNHHGAGKPATGRSLLQHHGYEVGIHIPACALAVDKDRLSSKVADWIRACDEGKRRRDHFIAGLHA